jgi:serine O-acetyltransferase
MKDSQLLNDLNNNKSAEIDSIKKLAHQLNKEKRALHVIARDKVEQFTLQLFSIMFPQNPDCIRCSTEDFTVALLQNRALLLNILADFRLKVDASEICSIFYKDIDELYNFSCLDLETHYNNDPSSSSIAEVFLTYPGFKAIVLYRIAHRLYSIGVPLIPRMITEFAHSITGIDIHPGATIGSHFSIDHGTGVVIGETTNIGNYVVIYQGVTLGALSVSKEIAKTKRHPTIEDKVIIYANATILGGETIIGRSSIIGGNSWITSSIPPFSKVILSKESGKTEIR